MREDTVVTKVYDFDELSEAAKEAAVAGLADINVNGEWWEGTFDDAATIGFKITKLDLGQDSYCGEWDWTEDAEETAHLILEHHGAGCETHRAATAFLATVEDAMTAFKAQPGYDAEYDEDFDESDGYKELCKEFQRTICEDYRIMLEKEYEHLTSEAAVIETIHANEYEFTADGKLYG